MSRCIVRRSHVRTYILRTPQGFLLVDSSLHGTYVNGERVQAHRILTDGDLIQIGAESFRFDLRSADAPSELGPTPAAPRDQPVRPHCAAGCGRYRKVEAGARTGRARLVARSNPDLGQALWTQ